MNFSPYILSNYKDDFLENLVYISLPRLEFDSSDVLENINNQKKIKES